MRAAGYFLNLLRRCHECNFPLGRRDMICPRCGAKQRREKLEHSLAFKGRARVGMGSG